MNIDEQELLSGLVFYTQSSFSKVRSKKGFSCSICGDEGVVYTENGVLFCPRRRNMNIYNSSLIPSRFSKCRNTRLDNGNWEIRERSIQNALEYSVKYVKEFPNLLPPFFVGSPGLGKTHLSVSIISELIFAHDQRCLFKEFRDLLTDIKDIYVRSGSEKEYVEQLCEYDVLVIDDLGATRMSEWETGVLDDLIARRYNAKKHTIFNSNLSFIDSKKHKQSDSGKILDYKIGERNVSRIFEMCHILELTGKDFRKESRS